MAFASSFEFCSSFSLAPENLSTLVCPRLFGTELAGLPDQYWGRNFVWEMTLYIGIFVISENFDGEWIGRLIQKFGFGLARGSTSHGGRRALVQLRREMRSGKPAGFAIDGPRGPARVAQPGAVWLSSLTGNPILPFHFEAARAWDLASWDGMQVPRPFSHVALAIGEPIHVPPGASAAQLEADRIELERSLAVLVERTGEMLASLEP